MATNGESDLRGIKEKLFTPSAHWLAERGVTADQVTWAGLGLDVLGVIIMNLSKVMVVDPTTRTQLFWSGVSLRALGVGCDAQDGTLARVTKEKGHTTNSDGALVDFTSDRLQEMCVFSINAIFALLSQEYRRAFADVLMVSLTLLPSYLRAKIEEKGCFTKEDAVGSRTWRVIISFVETASPKEVALILSWLNVILTSIGTLQRVREYRNTDDSDMNMTEEENEVSQAFKKIKTSERLLRISLPATLAGIAPSLWGLLR